MKRYMIKITKVTDNKEWVSKVNKMYVIGPRHDCFIEQYPDLISVLYRAYTAYIKHLNFNFTIRKIKRDKDGWWY